MVHRTDAPQTFTWALEAIIRRTDAPQTFPWALEAIVRRTDAGICYEFQGETLHYKFIIIIGSIDVRVWERTNPSRKNIFQERTASNLAEARRRKLLHILPYHGL